MMTNYCKILGISAWGAHDEHPTVNQVFHPDRGWSRCDFQKQASITWVRQLQAEGVTHVVLRCAAHRVDFSVADILSGGIAR